MGVYKLVFYWLITGTTGPGRDGAIDRVVFRRQGPGDPGQGGGGRERVA